MRRPGKIRITDFREGFGEIFDELSEPRDGLTSVFEPDGETASCDDTSACDVSAWPLRWPG